MIFSIRWQSQIFQISDPKIPKIHFFKNKCENTSFIQNFQKIEHMYYNYVFRIVGQNFKPIPLYLYDLWLRGVSNILRHMLLTARKQ